MDDLDSLRLQLAAEQHNHRRDNEHLFTDRARWIRCFNRLETAVRRQVIAREAQGFSDEADDALAAAHRAVMRELTTPLEARELGLARHSTQEEPGCSDPQNRKPEATS